MNMELLDERGLSKLRWRCRRGLLENDLFIEKFFVRHAANLTVRQADGMNQLMELADNDLLDLLLRRREPGADITTDISDEAREVLEMLRNCSRPLPAADLVAG
jgi:antitoxin CptB